MKNVPFTVLKLFHTNYSKFYSNNDNKYEIIDTNVRFPKNNNFLILIYQIFLSYQRVPYIAKFNKGIYQDNNKNILNIF